MFVRLTIMNYHLSNSLLLILCYFPYYHYLILDVKLSPVEIICLFLCLLFWGLEGVVLRVGLIDQCSTQVMLVATNCGTLKEES